MEFEIFSLRLKFFGYGDLTFSEHAQDAVAV
jgi:hypothetical protein